MHTKRLVVFDFQAEAASELFTLSLTGATSTTVKINRHQARCLTSGGIVHMGDTQCNIFTSVYGLHLEWPSVPCRVCIPLAEDHRIEFLNELKAFSNKCTTEEEGL